VTFRIESLGQTAFFVLAFLVVALIFFFGPRKRRADAPWYGASCIGFSGYALAAHTLQWPWPALIAGVAVLFGLIGLVQWIRHQR
jgi:hypothetical protein